MVVFAGTACATSDKKSTSAEGASDGKSPPAAGVTSDTIKIGFSYPDLESLATAGVIKTDHGPYDQIVSALVDDANSRGGIRGRKLELTTAKYSPVGNQEQLATCTKLTEDNKVFAVLNGLQGENNMCIVQQHSTILVGATINSTLLAKARAPWATWEASDERAFTALVRALDQENELDGKTIAVYGLAGYQPLIDAAVGALESAGHEVEETGINDAVQSDTQALASRDTVFAERFENAGVDTVVLATGYTPGANWDRAGFHPILLANSTNTLSAAKFTNPLDRFPTVAGLAPFANEDDAYDSPEMKRCRDVWTKATGQEIKSSTEENKLGKSTGYVAMRYACTSLRIFIDAATAAGPDLTQESFARGLASLGPIQIPSAARASFGANKPDANDEFQLMRFNPAWKSGSEIAQFLPIGDPVTLNE
jgi:hypothetical protein